LALMDL